jgi:hypothetical protein
MRSLCLLTFGCLVGLIVYNYNLKFETSALRERADKLAADIQDESDFLALMRAEVSHLSRPGRVEQMARAILKFEPITPVQTIPIGAVLPETDKGWRPEMAEAGGSGRRKDGIAALIDRTARAAGDAQH